MRDGRLHNGCCSAQEGGRAGPWGGGGVGVDERAAGEQPVSLPPPLGPASPLIRGGGGRRRAAPRSFIHSFILASRDEDEGGSLAGAFRPPSVTGNAPHLSFARNLDRARPSSCRSHPTNYFRGAARGLPALLHVLKEEIS